MRLSKIAASRALLFQRVALWLVVVVAVMPFTEAQAADACSCVHDTAMCVPYDDAGTPKRACVYLLNLHGPDLRQFQLSTLTETDVVAKVLRIQERKGGETNKRAGTARFFQLSNEPIDDERLSKEGILYARAFADVSDSKDAADGKPVSLGLLGPLTVKVGEESVDLSTTTAGVMPLRKHLDTARLGDVVELEITHGDRKIGSRYSWYRPRTEWVADYSLVGLAFSWPSWEFEGEPEVSIVPAMAELEYRYYKPNGGLYVFTSFGIGPNIAVDEAKANGTELSGTGLNGLIGAATLNLNGIQLGIGTRWAWSEGRFDPMLTLSITEALARGLGITDKTPDTLLAGQ